MNAPQENKTAGPTPPDRRIIEAGEAAFLEGLAKARRRGGPVEEIDALCARPPQAPTLLNGDRLTRMTLGIQRLMQKRAAMPGGWDNEEMIVFFARGPQAALILSEYSEEDQAWSDPLHRQRYEELVAEVDLLVDDGSFAAVNEWLSAELRTFTRQMNADDGSKKNRSAAGGSGSRVGWWLRAVEEICASYAAACPAGRDLTQWAIWEFPLNDYLAMLPASLERQGVEAGEHYAIKEARLARRKGKARAEAALTKQETPAGE